MTTTGELDAIIHDLHLIDLGDAADYLGEEEEVALPTPVKTTFDFMLTDAYETRYGCLAYE